MNIYPSGKIEIREEEIPTGGHYGCKTLDFDTTEIPATIGWHYKDFSWKFDISLLEAQILIDPENVGDTLQCHINPDTIVGALGAQMDSGSTTATFTVPDAVFIGMKIEIGGNDLGHVLSIADDRSSLTTEIAAPSNIAAAQLCKVTVEMASSVLLPAAGRYEIGASKIGGSYLPADTTLRIRYYNKVATAKDFSIFVEYLY